MDVTRPERPERGPRWYHAVMFAVVLAVAGAFAVAIDAATDADDAEVCTTTVYEGCPGRWDFG